MKEEGDGSSALDKEIARTLRGDLNAIVARAREDLDHPHPLSEAERVVPDQPGLYAIHGSSLAWSELGLGPPDARPLYVGKSEDSMYRRDVKTHFADGRTGQSTIRRSFAALLRTALDLHGIPRNLEKPAYFANFGLSVEHDAVLTRWMKERLRIAAWVKPTDREFPLIAIEAAILGQLQPPLNLQGISTRWTASVKAARRVMAEESRAWAESRQ